MAKKETRDDRMARYATNPLGDSAYGVYDKAVARYIETFSGAGAYRKAQAKWRDLVEGSG